MRTVAIVNPTYAADEGMVAQSYRAVARLRALYPGDSVRLVTADDTVAPLSATPSEADLRITTDFPRRGNLNGLSCIEGLLTLYRDVAERFGAQWIIKADSDVYINHLDWLFVLDAKKTSVVYTCGWTGVCQVAGPCYALSRMGVDGALQMLEREDVRQRILSSYGPEDRTITTLARMTGLSYRAIPQVQGLLMPFAKDAPDVRVDDSLKHPAVSFKDYFSSDALLNTTRRTRALERLTAYADWAEQRPLPDGFGLIDTVTTH